MRPAEANAIVPFHSDHCKCFSALSYHPTTFSRFQFDLDLNLGRTTTCWARILDRLANGENIPYLSQRT